MGKTSQAQSPRKTSCLPCRMKKIKCDGQSPCQRCVQKETVCLYTKPGAVGRPPKNAVVNKLTLKRTASATVYFSSTLCKEFIFENIGYGKHALQGSHPSYLYNDKDTGINIYIREIYKQYFGPNNSAAQTISKAPPNPESEKKVGTVKVYDLLQHFTWTTCEIVNIVVRRFSQLALQSYVESAFARHGLLLDRSNEFFGDFAELKTNPLNSLPPQQAIWLIESFFSIHPYCHLFSKTLILQSYWTDTADPFLMSVIYGTTVFFTQLFEGKPISLWETSTSSSPRNPFLDYAYCLLDKANAEITLSRYQAVVVLSHFEVKHGYAKRGISLFALGYMIAGRLGIQSNKQAWHQNRSDVEKDLLITTFWSSYNATVRGCIELDHIPREVLGKIHIPLPPANVAGSASYQFDLANNNHRLFKSYNYMFETFFTESVIAYFSSQLFLYFPESAENLFRISEAVVGVLFPEELQTVTAPNIKIERALKMILARFKAYIDHNKHDWTPQQAYTIESSHLLYEIHFTFLKAYVTTARLSHDHYQGQVPIATRVDRHLNEPLDLDNIDVIVRLYQVVPSASLLLEKMRLFLDNPHNYCGLAEWLPHSLMATCLETSANILILMYHRDPWDIKTWYDLKTVQRITEYQIWIGRTDIRKIRETVNDFFKIYPMVPEGEYMLTLAKQLDLVSLTSNVLIPPVIYDHNLVTTPESTSDNSSSTISLDSMSSQPLPQLFKDDFAWLDEILL